MNDPFISVILPAYNEGERIKKTLVAIRDYFGSKSYTAEIIVVSDGSSDNTASVVTSFAREFPEVRLIEYSPNRGKGYAVKTGMRAARGRFRLYMDADNAISITHLDSFLREAMNGKYDVVIGSIHLSGARRVIEYEWYRRALSFVGGILIRFCAGSGTTDALRAFKLFTADAASAIFTKQTIDRFGFDMEVLALARKHKFRIKELPVAWLNPYGDRVTLKGYFFTLWELVVIKWNLFRGVYGETTRKKFRHWAAIFIGVAVGLVYVSHHFFIPRFLRSPDVVYYPITKQAHYDEATFYALRANAAYRGPWISGDSSLAEYAGSPAILSIISPVIMGGLGRVLGSLQSAFVVSDFLFPAFIFFLLYFLFWELTGRTVPSLLFATLFIFSPKIGLYLPPVSALNARELLLSFLPFLAGHGRLYFSEIEEPKITFLFLIACVYLVVRALQRKETATTVGAGISFGLLFYTYFYDWVSVGIALAALAFMCLLQRDFSSVKKLALMGCVGAFTSSGYWFNFFSLHRLPQYQDIFSEVGIEIGRRFRFFSVWKSYVRNIVLVFCVAILPSLRRKPAVLFFVAMLLSYFVTVNIQVVTGFNVQPDHWYRTLFLPIFLVMSLLLVFLYDRYAPLSCKRAARPVAALFLVFFFSSYLVSEYRMSRIYAEDFTIPVSELHSYQWLNAHTPPGSVVGALAYDTNYALLLHTHNKVFLPVGLATVSPHNERWQRLFALSKRYALSPEQFKRHASGGAYYFFGGKYLDHGFDRSFYRNALNYTFPDALLKEKMFEYAHYSFNGTVPYRLDYIFVGPREEALASTSPAIASLPLVYNAGGVRIYRINHEH